MFDRWTLRTLRHLCDVVDSHSADGRGATPQLFNSVETIIKSPMEVKCSMMDAQLMAIKEGKWCK